ncbi:hypothetical protein AVO45_16825 [Ruegeria marisrubri]|uniref:DUF2125 domain-containing protein n=1 Tax=Ruegeria marisrubri TaxID=1685379 RepID=A0A0X3UC22_9RHOB|nr:DUF2125 domain-containing protein [Ruegeria marisrubri]KUJ85409.1 hypothetical protein AVO45_16825 [Ruegeria marisrubri]
MSVFLRRSCGAAIAYAIATQGAWADLTADQVWADWQAYMGGMGYQVSGDASSAGDVTTISDMTMMMEIPEENGQFSMVIPEVTLTENGDGTVNLGFPASFPLLIEGEAEGEVFRVELTYTHDGMTVLVSGSPEDMTYAYSAASVGVELTSVEADGEVMPKEALSASMNMADVSGMSKMVIGENRGLEQNFTAGSLTYDIAFDDPESKDAGKFKGNMNGLAFEGSGTMPAEMTAGDYQSMIDAGFDFAGTFTYDSGASDIAGTGEDEDFTLNTSSKGGRFAIAMDASRIAYDIAQNGVKLAVSTVELPFPLELAMASAGFKFEIPVQASDEEQPFALAMNLTGFTMSDVLWGMFDPTGALPRDPATIAIDTSGTAKVKVNFLDPAVAETLEATGAAPGEPHSLKINEFLVSMVGAVLSGTGEFTFDNSNLEAFDGMPAPTGVANLQLVGANALIDKLIAMGVMSENDAMGARMMMGMFGVPGDAPDTLNSTIEINEQGQILANGQRIK